jgi:GT2 family glycosyltransferase
MRMVDDTRAVYARAAAGGMGDGRPKLVSIVILSWNRTRALERCLDSIRRHTRLPYELVILDNGSTDPRALALCERLAAEPHTTVLFEAENRGCAGGRRRALRRARGDYVVTLDNDVEVQALWLERLVLRLEENPTIGAAACRVLRPDGTVELSGGDLTIEGRLVRFELRHHGLPATALETLEESDCAWVPGGATMFRREAVESAEHSEMFQGPWEDNDYSLQLTAKGFRLVTCPLATLVHHHRSWMDAEERRAEQTYLRIRDDPARIRRSLRAFYRRNGLIIHDRAAWREVGIEGLDEASLIRWLEEPEDVAVPVEAVRRVG